MADDDTVSMLIATMRSKRGGPGTRSMAARALGEEGDPRAIEPLLDEIQDTADPFRTPVVTAVLEALPRFGDALEPPLLRLLDDRGDFRRRYVPRLLVSARGAAAVPTLVALLADGVDEVVLNAATSLGSLRDTAYAAALRALVDDPARPSLVRGVAASALGMTGDAAAYDALAALLGTGEGNLVAGAIDGLAELADPRAIPLIQGLLAAGRLDERAARGATLALISLRNG